MEKLNTGLSGLYDSKFNGDIPEDIFRSKEKEYQNALLTLNAQMEEFTQDNPDDLKDVESALELLPH